MTKERKIAIEMWQAMREKVSKGEIAETLDMNQAKHDWLKEHDIDWYCDCWFCNYLHKARDDGYEEEESTGMTHRCPLNPCRPFRCKGRCPQYVFACNERYPMEQRLEAVDNIIKALKGEYKE